jgi:cytochrome P450 / NADPH-cytochrome P450 reductase
MRPFGHGGLCRRAPAGVALGKASKIQVVGLMSEPLTPEDFPGPHGLPFVGNVRAIDLANPIESLMSLAREYGPIFNLTSPAGISVVVSGVDLVSEICDDARSTKSSAGPVDLGRGPS